MSSIDSAGVQSDKYPEVDIPVSQIKLDEMNFRTDEVDSQRSAIRAMIDEQGAGLVVLAEHYLKHGLAPGERLIVIQDDTSDDRDSYVVMEGNRRATVLKLLSNPSLAKDTVIFDKFNELSKTFGKAPQWTLPCVVLPSRETALVWVEVKHSTGMGGAGVEKWGAPATARFTEYTRGKVVRWIAVIRFLAANGVDTKPISEGIARKTTAVSRVLNAGAMREELGVRFGNDGSIEFENGDTQAGVVLLAEMLEEMASSDFNTNRVHSFDARVDFIMEFKHLSVCSSEDDDQEDAEREDGSGARPADSGSKDSRGGSGARDDASSHGAGRDRSAGADGDHDSSDQKSGGGRSGSRGVKRGSRARSTLASTKKEDILSISNERINELYKEARRLKVEDHTCMASVFIRVFVELSCESFLESKKVQIPDHIIKRGGGRPTVWHSHGVKFREKIEACVSFVDPSNSMESLNDVRRGLRAEDQLQSPESLHAYVHGLTVTPSPRDLIRIWDRYHPLFVAMFS